MCHREYRPCLAYGTEFGEEYLDPQYFYLPVVHDKTCKQSVTSEAAGVLSAHSFGPAMGQVHYCQVDH